MCEDLIERLNDAWRKLYGDGDEHDVCDTINEAADALEAAREDACVALVADIRFACGDNGKRMQPELVEFIRDLAEDAARYQWLRALDGACDAAAIVYFNIGFDWIEQHGAELDAAIDQARGKGVA